MAKLGFISLLFLLEIWQRPLPLVNIPTYSNAPLVYQWLRQQTDVKAIIELPLGRIEEGAIPIGHQVTLPYEEITQDSPLVSETYRVYFAGFHDKKTLNGYSGYVPQSYQDAVAALKSFPDDASIQYLRAQGVSHIVLHQKQLAPNDRNRYSLTTDHPALTHVLATVDGDIVYEIKPY